MTPWKSPEEEIAALQRAAWRARCRVLGWTLRDTAAGQRVAARLACPDGWAAARFLLASALEDAETAGARDLALELRAQADTDAAFVAMVHEYVREHVRFVREAGEVFTSPDYTLAMAGGDCDDHARTVFALLRAGGIPARMAFLYRRGTTAGPTHVATQAGLDGRWLWMETTIAADVGEAPYDAARRLGLLTNRQDIATEVRTMTERDLPPLPAGFSPRSSAGELARDAQALRRLGYLCDDAPDPTDPTDPDFRAAVLKLQRDRAELADDSLIGPLTRRTIAGLLPLDEFGMAYRSSIGEVHATGATADLSDAFFGELAALARDYSFDLEWMLDVMWSESGINPAAKYRRPPNLATGLIGFVDLARLGAAPDNTLVSHDAFATLSAAEQMRYVRKFWAPMKGRATSGATLYQYNFLPASLDRGTTGDTVLAARGGTGYGGREGTFYDVNQLLDVDGDGAITVADLAARLDRAKRNKAGDVFPRYTEALARARAASPSSGGVRVSTTAIGLLLLAACAAVAADHA